MSRTRRAIFAILAAAVLAVAGCTAVLAYVRGSDVRAVAGKQAVKVLVAAKRIPAGTTGAEMSGGGYTDLVLMPRSALPSDYLESIEPDLQPKVLNADLKPRQLVLRGSFEDPSTSTVLRIPDGKIAVTVPVSNNMGTVFLVPGSKIAFFDTYTVLEGKGIPAGDRLAFDHTLNQATRLLLTGIEVLATGVPGSVLSSNQDASKSGGATIGGSGVTGADKEKQADSSNSPVGMLVTVAATQGEAERLIHASQTGTLYFALLDDNSQIRSGPGVDNSSLFN